MYLLIYLNLQPADVFVPMSTDLSKLNLKLKCKNDKFTIEVQ